MTWEQEIQVQAEIAAENEYKKGMGQGIELGKNQGKNETLFEMAKKMSLDGVSVDVICKYTVLSDETIAELDNQLKNDGVK